MKNHLNFEVLLLFLCLVLLIDFHFYYHYKNYYYINKLKNGRNIFENVKEKEKEKEKEKPYTNCSTTNSKSIVNLNYYDNLI